MKNKNKFNAIINFICAILFFIIALMDKNYYFIPVGCCFIVAGISFLNKKNK